MQPEIMTDAIKLVLVNSLVHFSYTARLWDIDYGPAHHMCAAWPPFAAAGNTVIAYQCVCSLTAAS